VKKIITIIFIVTISKLMAQNNPKTIYIQIDTLEYKGKLNELYNFEVEIDNGDVFQLINSIDSAKHDHSTNTFPNYTAVIPNVVDSNVLKIPIDNHSSQLILEHIYHFDTIHIEKISVFETQPLDSIFSREAKFKIVDGKRDNYSFETTYRFETNPARKAPTLSHIVINGRLYPINLNVTQTLEITLTNGVGTKPKRTTRRNGKQKKNIIRIEYSVSFKEYYWMSEINLDEIK